MWYGVNMNCVAKIYFSIIDFKNFPEFAFIQKFAVFRAFKFQLAIVFHRRMKSKNAAESRKERNRGIPLALWAWRLAPCIFSLGLAPCIFTLGLAPCIFILGLAPIWKIAVLCALKFASASILFAAQIISMLFYSRHNQLGRDVWWFKCFDAASEPHRKLFAFVASMSIGIQMFGTIVAQL